MIDDPRFRIRQSQFFQVRQLQRFRNLMIEATVAIDDAHALTFEVRKIVERIENPVPQSPLPRRRAHAIEEQRIIALRRRNIKIVVPRINLQPRHAAFIQLLKQRPEPVRMLVVNGDGLFEPRPVPIRFRAHEASRIPFKSLSSQFKIGRSFCPRSSNLQYPRIPASYGFHQRFSALWFSIPDLARFYSPVTATAWLPDAAQQSAKPGRA